MLTEPLKERESEILYLMAEGMTNQEIADRLYISVETVRWYAKSLYAKLQVSGREEAAQKARKLSLLDGGEQEQPSPQHDVPNNLPASLTRFIGRKREIQAAMELLAATRLLTLTGPGGTGKTRLSLEIGARVSSHYPHGVWFVSLTPVADPELVVNAIADVLDVPETRSESLLAALKRAVQNRSILLILDNYEHVLAAAPVVSELLSAAQSLKILVTSREPLQVYGEQRYPVPPLTLPATDNLPLEQLSKIEAISLFIQRAQSVRPTFQLTAESAAAVTAICRKLDGLPLAIELAASQVRLLPPTAIAERLDDCLMRLTGGRRDAPDRHRTLRAAIDWSYSLLSEDEKRFFTRMAVFRGGWCLDAVETICCMELEMDALDGMATLVDKSLVRVEEDIAGEARFSLLQTIYEYACERLVESDMAEDMLCGHANYFIELVERAAPELRRARQISWFARLDAELDNIRAALHWSLLLGNDIEGGVRLVVSLRDFWFYQGYHAEGQRWVDQALERSEDVSPALQGRLLVTAAFIAYARLNPIEAARLHLEAQKIFRKLDDLHSLGFSLVSLGQCLCDSSKGQPDVHAQAYAYAHEGLTLLRAVGDDVAVAQALNVLGNITRADGDYDQARSYYEECAAIVRATGEKRREAMILQNLAITAIQAGDYGEVDSLIRTGIELETETDFKYTAVMTLANCAGILAIRGFPEQAATLLGASVGLQVAMNFTIQPGDQPYVDGYLAQTRAQLDEATFQTAWAAGQAMSLREAQAYALERLLPKETSG